MSRARLLLVLALALLVLPSFSRPCLAALEEKPVLDMINDNVAVLRYLNKQIFDMEEDLKLVHASRALTQKQLDAQKALVDSELAAGNKERAEMFRANLTRLQRQMVKLNEFDFEKLYADRIAALNIQIKIYTAQLDARMTEYSTLFGKKTVVDLDFRKEYERSRGTRLNAAAFLDLD